MLNLSMPIAKIYFAKISTLGGLISAWINFHSFRRFFNFPQRFVNFRQRLIFTRNIQSQAHPRKLIHVKNRKIIPRKLINSKKIASEARKFPK